MKTAGHTTRDWPVQVLRAPVCPACGSDEVATRTSKPVQARMRQAYMRCKACEARFGVLLVAEAVTQ